ncbi:MAG: aconitate hydratase AcnA [Chloroflexota bacterium]|nr:aconitate hydratase AcnA [Chloroflexota bacterium]
MLGTSDRFGVRTPLTPPSGETYTYFSLEKLAAQGVPGVERAPFTVKVMLENLLRNGGELASEEHIRALAAFTEHGQDKREFPFLPSRVILQDFTGVPVVVDLAAMRSAAARLGADPQRINPLVQTDLVIDHSVQVDYFGTVLSFNRNVEREYERNFERYALLRWAQKAFHNFRVVPPGTGIVHQVNLEFLGKVVQASQEGSESYLYPDTLVGTDSHTTMINALGVLGWGVGGIEAEAVQLGQPIYLLTPEVVGFRFTGALPEGATATDLVLTVTQMLRKKGVVDKFVEFYGPGLSALSLPDRATISNMSPEYGATAAIFPVDDATLRYLRMTGRSEDLIASVDAYTKAQGMFRTDESPDPVFNDVLELDLGTVEPSLAGPRRPQDRVPLALMKETFRSTFAGQIGRGAEPPAEPATLPAADGAPTTAVLEAARRRTALTHGSVVIAAITSCTNTSNPSVMLGAGILAKKAVERGLTVHSHVKTSLAPGSQVVTDYLEAANLLPYLEALRFHVVGYGCTTCIGNSGNLPGIVTQAVEEQDLVVAAVLSGNRNFEGRINPLVRAAYLASPPLVVAYALAGTIDIDLSSEPLGFDPNGMPVYLRDVWPTSAEVQGAVEAHVGGEMFARSYSSVFAGDEHWQELPVPEGALYEWDQESTYVQEPPYFEGLTPEPRPVEDIRGARVLALLGDSVTTDHISPAGSISRNGAAGQYLIERGVKPVEFNSFGSRRGNHEVMMRGTFGNIRLRNQLTPDREGSWTVHFPSGEVTSIYDAARRYADEGTPLVVLAGQEYGTGSSRDWAAKGTLLLGVRAVIAQSYERIHRSNLVGMGVLPLQFRPGESAESLGLSGAEMFDIEGIAAGLRPRQSLTIRARRDDGSESSFEVTVRIDTPMELEYYRHGGILPMVLRQLVGAVSA